MLFPCSDIVWRNVAERCRTHFISLFLSCFELFSTFLLCRSASVFVLFYVLFSQPSLVQNFSPLLLICSFSPISSSPHFPLLPLLMHPWVCTQLIPSPVLRADKDRLSQELLFTSTNQKRNHKHTSTHTHSVLLVLQFGSGIFAHKRAEQWCSKLSH